MSYVEWGLIPASDRQEMADNRCHTKAMKLLRIIKDNLDPSDFTLEQIRLGFNVLNAKLRHGCGKIKKGAIGNQIVEYTSSDLEYLVNRGLCGTTDGKAYFVCHYDPIREEEEEL